LSIFAALKKEIQMNSVKKILISALLLLGFSINAQTLSDLYEKVNPL